MPFFSVIVTVFNKEKLILDTLKTVCTQSFTDFEILIINDGSTDNSLLEISKTKDSRIKLFSISNSGVSHARNYGVEKSTGRYCAFIDGDDLWENFHLLEMKKLIDTFSNHSVFSCASSIKKKERIENLFYTIDNTPQQTLDYFKASLNSSIIHPSSFVIKKEIYIKTKGFNTKYNNGEDAEYWFRLGLKYPIAFSKKSGVLIREVENSLSNQKYNPDNYCYFEEFDHIKSENESFYKVLDNNLFSAALLCKENNFKKEYTTLKSRIDKRKNLTLKQKIILNAPPFCIQTLRKVKSFLNEKGISFTIY
jgi:glycosyltransferase involved in cell wall biosynthesis